MIKKILCLLLLVNNAYAQEVDTVYSDTTITVAFINKCMGDIEIPDTIRGKLLDTTNIVSIQLFHEGDCFVEDRSFGCLRIYKARIRVRTYTTKPKTDEKN